MFLHFYYGSLPVVTRTKKMTFSWPKLPNGSTTFNDDNSVGLPTRPSLAITRFVTNQSSLDAVLGWEWGNVSSASPSSGCCCNWKLLLHDSCTIVVILGVGFRRELSCVQFYQVEIDQLKTKCEFLCRRTRTFRTTS